MTQIELLESIDNSLNAIGCLLAIMLVGQGIKSIWKP